MIVPVVAQWIFGALLFSAMCGVAAWAAERALRVLGVATRWPWAFAMVAAVCWPLVAPMVLNSAPVAMTAPTIGSMTDVSMATPIAVQSAWRLTRDALWSGQYDRLLVWLWALASLALIAQTLSAIVTLRRMRKHAGVQQVDGEWVLVNDALGPAVIGVLHPAIVVPSWFMALDQDLRALVLRHEREHCRANDAVLVWMSVIATTVLPWNAAIWWIARRLRLAMEIDCDARTLRGNTNRAQYGKLLLLIAQHKMSARFAPALSYSTSQLHRRIRAMTPSRVRFRSAHIVGSATVVVVALLAACSSRIAANLTSPTPTNNAAVAPASALVVAAPAAVIDSPAADLPYFDFQVTTPATMVVGSKGPVYPAALREARTSGQVLAQFVVGREGAVDIASIKILKTDHEQFSQSVRDALATLRFTPAVVNGNVVKQLVQAPFVFRTSNNAGDVPTPRAVRASDTSRSATIPTTPSTPTASIDRPYFDFQVTQPATMVAGTKGPLYPESLRAAKTQGKVLAQFVVDANGTVETRTIKILKSDDPLFSDAVKTAIAAMAFNAATKDGRAVKQLVQMPFQFSTQDNR